MTRGKIAYVVVTTGPNGWTKNIFETIVEAQEQARERLWTYNNDWPSIAICGITTAMKLKLAA